MWLVIEKLYVEWTPLRLQGWVLGWLVVGDQKSHFLSCVQHTMDRFAEYDVTFLNELLNKPNQSKVRVPGRSVHNARSSDDSLDLWPLSITQINDHSIEISDGMHTIVVKFNDAVPNDVFMGACCQVAGLFHRGDQVCSYLSLTIINQ